MSKVIFVDNGHGINTPGKRSPDGRLREGEWTREVAGIIVRGLTSMGYEARLLTPEETDIKISERVERVNCACRQRGADNVMLLSVHVNAASSDGRWHTARGFLSFVAPNAGIGSKTLARIIYDGAVKIGLKGNRWVTKDKYTVRPLAICRDTACTAVLTENLFMDNREDCAYLLTDEGKTMIAQMHIDAITKYLAQ